MLGNFAATLGILVLSCTSQQVTAKRKVHKRCICRQCVAFCRPGKTLRELHHLSIQLLSEGLADLGVCGRMGPASIAQNAYSTFYPHSVGELIHLFPSICSETDLWLFASLIALLAAVDRTCDLFVLFWGSDLQFVSIHGMYTRWYRFHLHLQ